MSNSGRSRALLQLLPVLLLTASAMLYVAQVEGGEAYAWRNMAPMLVVILLSMLTLWRGGGRWHGAGWQWPLGTLGFAIPALGLSLYLHYNYAVDLDGLFGGAPNPQELFRYLPLYTAVSGAIGFAIGWIAGRNV